jgi:hypothetical protein
MHVLKMLLGARLEAVRSGSDLCMQMHQWQSSSVSAVQNVFFIECVLYRMYSLQVYMQMHQRQSSSFSAVLKK